MPDYREIVLTLFLGAALAGCANTESPPEQLNIERSNIMASYATVEGVDMATRMVTLRDPEGKSFTIHAGQEVVNLPQLRAGDRVDVTYAESLRVRMAEPGEAKNEITGIIGRAAPGDKPAAVNVIENSITATIHGIDKVNETATLQMQDGSYRTVKVQDPANLDRVKVGDRILIVYQEAAAIIVKGKGE